MRTYKNITYAKEAEIIRTMQVLSEPGVSVERYRAAFYRWERL